MKTRTFTLKEVASSRIHDRKVGWRDKIASDKSTLTEEEKEVLLTEIAKRCTNRTKQDLYDFLSNLRENYIHSGIDQSFFGRIVFTYIIAPSGKESLYCRYYGLQDCQAELNKFRKQVKNRVIPPK